MIDLAHFKGLPGHELLEEGIQDLEAQRLTPAAVLLHVAALGIVLPPLPASERGSDMVAEHLLYDPVQHTGGHSRYLSLLRRMASFAACLERERGRLT